jgi:hypothetical protein
VSKTISVTGSNYTVAGSGFRCGLVWRGEPGRPMVELSGAENVTLANIAVGHHDFGPMKHGADVLVTSPQGNATRVVLDEVYAFGMYQKMPDEHGIHFRDLPPGSIVDARHVQGNLRITGCGDAQLLFRTSYEGTVTVEGDVGSGDGFLGFLTRLATVSEPALRVRDNRSVAMSDFYIEQCQQAVVLSGGDGQSAGRVTLQLPKIHTETVKPLFDVGDYAGRIWCGQSQFYCEPERTTFVSRGTNAAQLILAGNFWYKSRPQFDLAEGCRRVLAGNAGAPDTPDHAEELAWIAAALDDLRRLGKVDTELSQRIAPSVMR